MSRHHLRSAVLCGCLAAACGSGSQAVTGAHPLPAASWGPPQMIADAGGGHPISRYVVTGGVAAAAIDTDGRAFVLIRHVPDRDVFVPRLLGASWEPGRSPTPPWRLSHPLASAADSGDIAVDGDGLATAVWWEELGSLQSVAAARATADGSWAAADAPGGAFRDLTGLRVAADASEAVAIWSGDGEVWTSRRGATGVWETAHTLAGLKAPFVAGAPATGIMAVWLDTKTGAERYALRRARSATWDDADDVPGTGSFRFSARALKADALGNFLLAGRQGSGASQIASVIRYVRGRGWETPVALGWDTAPGYLSGPGLRVGPQGHALAYGLGPEGVVVWRYTPGMAWGGPERLAGAREFAAAALDARGNALVVCKNNGLEFSRAAAGGPWTATQTVPGTDGHRSIEGVELAMNARGDAILVWAEEAPPCASCPAPRAVWGARFALP